MSAFGVTKPIEFNPGMATHKMLEADMRSRLFKLGEYEARNPIDVFLWGVAAGMVGTIGILLYVFYSA